MRNAALFLYIHEGVQPSHNYGKPDEYKSKKQHYSGANRKQKYGQPARTSLKNIITAALTRSKFSRKPTMNEGNGFANQQTSTLKKALPNSLAESSCRSPGQRVYRSFPAFSCSPVAAGDSCSHEESLSRTILRKQPLVAVQQDDISLDQNAIFNGRTMARRMQIRSWTWKYNEKH